MRSPSRTYTWDTRPMIFAANSARWAAATTPVLWPVSLTGWRATVKTATASAGLSDSALATARWLLSLHAGPAARDGDDNAHAKSNAAAGHGYGNAAGDSRSHRDRDIPSEHIHGHGNSDA